MKEFWVTEYGNIEETERNPCRCCKDSYDHTTSRWFGKKHIVKTFHIGHYPRKSFLKMMKSRGLERLK